VKRRCKQTQTPDIDSCLRSSVIDRPVTREERSVQELRFDNRVAVITGAGRGLGRTYALLLASRGAKVVVNDTGGSLKGEGGNAGPAQEVVGEIRSAGGEAVACPASVSTPEGGSAIIKAALDHYGRIDILIHNAGIVRAASLKEMTQADFDAVLDVHLRGAFHVVRPAFVHMCKAGYGRVVLTSSIGGLYGNHRVANYGVAKAGMIGLSNVVALEGAAEGVKCNLIVPGAVTRMAEGLDTSAYPPMSPELVAPVVGWLAHESCSISGEMLISIAGRVARAFIAESPGVYRGTWSIEQVAEQMDAIRNTDAPFIAAVVPTGHVDHIRYSFEMAAKGRGRG
jgi:NAD(P)-dependent dehydrogenase (short-subunit alcohol dehydrogenase family)